MGYFAPSYFGALGGLFVPSGAPYTPGGPVAQGVLFNPRLNPPRLFPARLFPFTGATTIIVPPALLDLRQALTAFLLADPTLSSIVGPRVRPGGFSEADVTPAIGYWVLKNHRGHILRGAAGFAVAHVQLDCWSRNLADCVASKIAIEAILDGKVPVMPGFPVRYTKQLDEQDLHEAPGDGSDRWLYHIALIYFVKYDSSRPSFP
jgi:hypothetical protein